MTEDYKFQYNPIRLVPKANAEVDADIVNVLERWLVRAREGEFDALAIVSINRDGSFSHCLSRSNNRTGLMGALAHVQHRISVTLDEENP